MDAYRKTILEDELQLSLEDWGGTCIVAALVVGVVVLLSVVGVIG